MTSYVEALAADRAELLTIGAGLDEGGWSAPSGCVGWSVKDLVAHMGALYWTLVDPGALPPEATGLPTEAAQEVYVGSRRSMTTAEVLEDYAAVSEVALGLLAGFADVDSEVPLGDLGTYPLHILPAAFCFDHYTHIRADLFAPRGPLAGPPPIADELRLGPAMDWIEAALPQQNQARLSSLSGPIEIVITGVAGRTIHIGDAGGPVSASVTSDADSCVRWASQRASWDDVGVHGEGDKDSLIIAQALKVF